MPSTPNSTALSELYLVQALPNDFTLIAGKFDWSGTADPTLFSNNERTQFLHNALNNTVLGAFVPYSSIGAAVSKQLTPELSGTLSTFSNDSDAQSFNFDTFDLDTMTYAYTMAWTPTFGNRPGNYNFIIGGSNKDLTNFDVSADYLLEEVTGQVPVAEKSTNYAYTVAASQYLWVDESVRRWDGRPAGICLFFRNGGAPKDRNVIDAFYSVGLGGTIGAFGRSNDSWGIGWAGTHISSDFRCDAGVLGADVESMEHAYEAYYSVGLTPAITASAHIQHVKPADGSSDDFTGIAARLQFDF